MHPALYLLLTLTITSPLLSQECTPKSCFRCNTDSSNQKKFCSLCGNGKTLKYAEEFDRTTGYCSSQDSIKNCFIFSADGKKCLECDKTYVLVNQNSCVSGASVIHKCLYAELLEDGNTYKCHHCQSGFASKHGTFCLKKFIQPDNCEYGGRITNVDLEIDTFVSFEAIDTDEKVMRYLKMKHSAPVMKPCLKCKEGFYVYNGSCVKEELKGCMEIFLGDKEKCLKCNFRNFYFATDVVYHSDNVQFQTCTKFGRVFYVSGIFLLLIIIFL